MLCYVNETGEFQLRREPQVPYEMKLIMDEFSERYGVPLEHVVVYEERDPETGEVVDMKVARKPRWMIIEEEADEDPSIVYGTDGCYILGGDTIWIHPAWGDEWPGWQATE